MFYFPSHQYAKTLTKYSETVHKPALPCEIVESDELVHKRPCKKEFAKKGDIPI